ncbi:hypothetical protein D1BOALGB6SA_1282 [Olavius sp. associated proteobacterium Delta 1]|nr:hypothetical protein D1BOALGB6SA_1282 [Olavius sp. associated proteobacterium Delta 1]
MQSSPAFLIFLCGDVFVEIAWSGHGSIEVLRQPRHLMI